MFVDIKYDVMHVVLVLSINKKDQEKTSSEYLDTNLELKKWENLWVEKNNSNPLKRLLSFLEVTRVCPRFYSNDYNNL